MAKSTTPPPLKRNDTIELNSKYILILINIQTKVQDRRKEAKGIYHKETETLAILLLIKLTQIQCNLLFNLNLDNKSLNREK